MLVGIVTGSAAALVMSLAGQALTSVLVAAALTAGCIAGGRRLTGMTPDRMRRLALGLVIGALAFRLVYVAVMRVEPAGDFRQMWEFALRFADSPATVRPRVIEELRALPYLTPLAILGRGRVEVVQVANCILLALTAWLAFRLAERHLGIAAATLGLGLVAVAPEPTLAAEVLTHDVPGTFFLVVALFLLDALDGRAVSGRRVRQAGLAIALGLVLLVLTLLRGSTPFVLAGAALVALRGGAGLVTRVFMMVILPLLTHVLASRALDGALGMSTGRALERHRWVWMAAYANSTSSGTFPDLANLWPYFRQMSTTELRGHAKSVAASDLADRAISRPPNYVRRVGELHRLGLQLWLYLPSPESPVRTRVLRPIVAGMRLFMLAALLAGLGMLLSAREGGRYLLPLLTLSTLVVSLGLLGESQPRYLFPYWFLLAPVAALPFVRGWSGAEFNVTRVVGGAGVLALLTAAFVMASWIVDRSYSIAEGRVLRLRPAMVRGDGAVRRTYEVVLEASTQASGLDLVHRFSPSGGLTMFAAGDTVRADCKTTLRSYDGARVRDSVALGSAARLQLELPVDSILVTAAAADPARPCRVTLRFLRETHDVSP